MTELIDLLEGKPVFLDDRTAGLGGGFYRNPTTQPYSPLPLKWAWEQLIRYERAIMLDVGASTGCFTLLSRHHPNLQVWAFEAVPLTATVLRENIYLNGLTKKCFVNQIGVSNFNGTDTLYEIKSDGGKGVSMVGGKPAWHKDCNEIPIEVITIDSFVVLHNIIPTLLKVDTEGGEKAVLQGAIETIEKYHPMLIIEISQENADQYGYYSHEIVKMVSEWGYVWTSPEGLDLLCVHRDWNKENDV